QEQSGPGQHEKGPAESHGRAEERQMSRWYDYVQRVLREHGISAAAAARQAGLAGAGIHNWKNGTRPYAALAVRFARGMGENVLEALVECELITEDEAARPPEKRKRSTVKWFGSPWPSDESRAPGGEGAADRGAPPSAGESCVLCGEGFKPDAQGITLPHLGADLKTDIRYAHIQCIVANVGA